MPKTKSNNINPERYWILLGIPIIIIFGSLMHFVYDWSGNLPLVGFFAPINESVWEHLKLAFYPTLFWWLLGYHLYNENLNIPNWIFASAVSMILGPLIITVLYYIYVGTLGTHNLYYDIIIYILSIIISQLASFYVYTNIDFNDEELYIVILSIIILIIAFTIFTYNPPDFSIFTESNFRYIKRSNHSILITPFTNLFIHVRVLVPLV